MRKFKKKKHILIIDMESGIEEGEIITNKPHSQAQDSVVSQHFPLQEQCDSSLQSLTQSEASSQRNITTSRSSFKKVSRSSQDLQNLTETSSYYCAYYNLIGHCTNHDCKQELSTYSARKRHYKVTVEDGLDKLVDENLDLLDRLIRNGDKVRIPPSVYENKLERYRNERRRNQRQLVASAQAQGKDLVNPLPHISTAACPILKPQPQLDFKQLQEIVDKQGTSSELVNEFKKDLMARLKQDIDKMQDKLKTIKCLKRWVQEQRVDENEFYDLYYSLNNVQQLAFRNFFQILDLKSPELSYSVEVRQSFNNFLSAEQPLMGRQLLENKSG